MDRRKCEEAKCEYLHGDYCYDVLDFEDGGGSPVPLDFIDFCNIAEGEPVLIKEKDKLED